MHRVTYPLALSFSLSILRFRIIANITLKSMSKRGIIFLEEFIRKFNITFSPDVYNKLFL